MIHFRGARFREYRSCNSRPIASAIKHATMTAHGLQGMSETSNWAGALSGTSNGTVIVEINREGNQIEGTLLVFDPAFGRMEAQLTGEWDPENKISATLAQFRGSSSDAAALPRTGTISANYDPFQDVIKGVWQTDAETAGDFCWVKVATPVAVAAEPAFAEPAVPASNGPLRYSGQIVSNVRDLFSKRGRAAFAQRNKGWLVVAVGLAIAIIFGFLMADYLGNN